jgi:hypothetical protein
MPATPKVEAELDFLVIGGNLVGVWSEITADVLSTVRIGHGIRGSGPADRVASAGSCTFGLDNSERNSASTLGYYSPGGASRRFGWRLGVRVRVSLQDPSTSVWHVRFIGWIQSITPSAGRYGARTVQVIATDWIDEAARATTSGLSTQVNKRSDELISTLIGAVATGAIQSRAPVALSIATGLETFPFALDTARDDRPNSVLQEIARVTLSELGYFYLKANGTAVFEARSDRLNTSDAATFNNSMTSLSVSSSRESVLSKVQVITHPRTVDATATSVLYRLQTTTPIPSGQTLTIVGGYTDPNNRASRIGGVNMQAPTKGVDYVANFAQDGTGADATDNLAIVSTFSGNAATYEITNTANQTVYVTKLQAVGRGLYDYEQTTSQAESSANVSSYGEQVVALDLPYLTSPATGLNIAQYLLSMYDGPLNVGSIEVGPQTSSLLTQILTRDVGDRIAVQETVTGVSSSYYIQAVDLMIVAPGNVWATWTLASADTSQYWALGVDGFTELGETTVLSF